MASPSNSKSLSPSVSSTSPDAQLLTSSVSSSANDADKPPIQGVQVWYNWNWNSEFENVIFRFGFVRKSKNGKIVRKSRQCGGQKALTWSRPSPGWPFTNPPRRWPHSPSRNLPPLLRLLKRLSVLWWRDLAAWPTSRVLRTLHASTMRARSRRKKTEAEIFYLLY